MKATEVFARDRALLKRAASKLIQEESLDEAQLLEIKQQLMAT